MMALAMRKQEEIELLRAENERLKKEICDLRSLVLDELTAEGERLGLYQQKPTTDDGAG